MLLPFVKMHLVEFIVRPISYGLFHLQDHIPQMITFDYVLKVGEAGTGETDQRAEENY